MTDLKLDKAPEPVTSDTYAMGWVLTALHHMMEREEIDPKSISLVRILDILKGYSSDQVEEMAANLNSYIDWDNIDWSPENYLLQVEIEETFMHLRKPETLTADIPQPKTLEQKYGSLLGILTGLIGQGVLIPDSKAMQGLIWTLEGNPETEAEKDTLEIAKLYQSNYPAYPEAQ